MKQYQEVDVEAVLCDEHLTYTRLKQTKVKLPRTVKQLAAFYNEAYQAGYSHGSTHVRRLHAAERDRTPSLTQRQDEARLQALKTVTQFASVAGQTIDAFAKAMQSERGQL